MYLSLLEEETDLNNFYDEIKKIHPIGISVSDFNKNEIPKNVRNSIFLYNKAIENLKINSVDSAIIDLKKSLSHNSNFCEAIKLLGLCYAYRKDFSKAEKFFNKLRKYTIYSSVANDCLKELKAEKTASEALDAIRNAGRGNVISRQLKTISNIVFLKKCAVFLSAAIIITALSILAYKLHPNINIIWNKALNSKAAQNSSSKTNTEVKQKETEAKKYIQLTEDNKSLQTNLDNTKSELDNYKNKYDILLQLNNAEKLYKDGNYEKASGILLTLKNLTLDDTSKAKFDTLWKDIKSNTVWTIYNQANNLYKQGKYSEALPMLKIVQEIAPDQNLMPWILYQIGMCYKETNDSANALVYFQKVKTDYPNSKYAHYPN